MTLVVLDANGAKKNLSTTLDDSGNMVGSTSITDPISGAKQTVSQLHNADQQTVPTNANSALSTGVAQLQDGVSGLANRQREAGQDNVAPLGISSGAANFAMQFKTTCVQNLASGVNSMTLAAVSGAIGGVPWIIRQGSKLVIDSGVAQETMAVQSVNASTKVVTFTTATANAHNGSVTPFSIIGMSFNQERDASGENDGATGSGTAVAAGYEFNGGDPSGGNFDRARSINGKGLKTQAITAGGGAGSVSLTIGANAGLQPGMKVLLYKASTFPAAGSFESVNADLSYVAGTNTVPLASAIVGAVGYDTLAYDAFAALGPQTNGFLPFGVPVDTLALFDAVSGLMLCIRNAPGHNGAVYVSSDGAKATYRYAGSFTPAATPTDLITIAGSATKTGRLKRISLGGLATTAGSMPITIIRRSALNTAGTSAPAVIGKHDLNDATPTIVPNVWTVNPTGIGATAGNVGQGRLWLPLSTGQPFPLVWEFSTRQDKAIVLRGVNDIIAINGNGAAVPAGGSIDFEIEIEEDNS